MDLGEAGEFGGEEPIEDRHEPMEREDSVEIEAASVEPEAVVERAGDYMEAEEIEDAVIEAVDTQITSDDPIPIEAIGKEASVPTTEEWSPSGDVQDRPTKELEESEGSEMLGFVDDLSGGMTKAEVATHELGNEDIKRKERTSIKLDGEPVELGEDLMERERLGSPDSVDPEVHEHGHDEVALDGSPKVDGIIDDTPVSNVSKIDSFTRKLDVADEEVGDFRIPSKHEPKIEPLPSRDPSGGHLETPGDASDLEVTEKESKPPLDPDARPAPVGGDQEHLDEPVEVAESVRSEVSFEPKTENWSTSGDVDDRPAEEIALLVKEVFTRAFLEDEYLEQLIEDPDSVLREQGIVQGFLPDLSDPDSPAMADFIRDVRDEVFLRGEVDTEHFLDDLHPEESMGDLRMLLLQSLIDRENRAVQILSSIMKNKHDTVKSIIQNLK